LLKGHSHTLTSRLPSMAKGGQVSAHGLQGAARRETLQRTAAALGSCGVCATLLLRLGLARSSQAFQVAGSTGRVRSSPGLTLGSPRDPVPAASQLRLIAVEAKAVGRRGCSRGSCAVSSGLAASALVAGGAAAGRRRRVPGPKRELWMTAAGSDSAAVEDADDEVIRTGKAPVAEPEGDKGPLAPLVDKWNSFTPEFQEDLKTFFSSLTVALAIRGFLVEPRFIPSLSMYPTFDIGDQLTVDKISRNWRDYTRRDVVVFNPPPPFFVYAGIDRSGEALIKRIVAIEGDTVEVKNGGNLYINGEQQDEPFTNEKAKYDFGPVTVPKGCVFVLGDNRNASLDGHVWGFLPKENIIGRATLKFWPPWRVGSVQASPP